MKGPEALKSKTIRGLLTAAVIVILSLLGVGEEQIGKTYDTINDHQGKTTERAKDVGMLGAILYSVYGRSVAKGPLKWKKEDDNEKD
ncbi:hypothetical protein LCGC14_0403430 [marine sediment metagenome]|uniref:Uncharacterized protein n=1 Tax=marine sediment metagenome TaxID=412755 RepID=A0A0F9SW84_9ZZZZ